MRLSADEDFDFNIVKELRLLGHDVLTAQEDGQRGIPDPGILARAHALLRSLLTHNRRDFERLDRRGDPHSGIISTKQAPKKHVAMANGIDAALSGKLPARWCVRVNRPP
jgi:hypothetical protein